MTLAYCRPSGHFPHVWQTRAAKSAAAFTPDVQLPIVPSSGETRGTALSNVCRKGPISSVLHQAVPFLCRMIVSAACAKTSISAVFGSIAPPLAPRLWNSMSENGRCVSVYIFSDITVAQLTLKICEIQHPTAEVF